MENEFPSTRDGRGNMFLVQISLMLVSAYQFLLYTVTLERVVGFSLNLREYFIEPC